MPDNTVPYNHTLLQIIAVYYQSGQNDKAYAIASRLGEYCEQELNYLDQFTGVNAIYTDSEKKELFDLLDKLGQISKTFKQPMLEKQINSIYKAHS